MNTQKNVVSLLSLIVMLCLPNKLNAVNACIFDLGLKGVIDLTSIGCVDGIPAWKNVHPEKSDDHVYSYNPCHSFTQGSCVDVAACQTYATNDNLAYSLGTQNSAQWKITSGQDLPTLVYKSTERTLYVDLRCLDSSQPTRLDVHGYDFQTQLYTMTLSSKCACWNGCKDGPAPGPGRCSRSKPSNGLSGGAIVIILLILLIFIYLVTFMAFNKFKRQATGIDILPHRTFWISLPGYSLDGVKFIFRQVIGKGTAYTAVP